MIDIPLEFPSPLRDAINNELAEPGQRARRVILITEWEDTEGSVWVTGWTDCTPWAGEGLLRYALRHGLYHRLALDEAEDSELDD